MTDPTPAADIARIPLAHSVRYVARGLPDLPFQYGRGVIRPAEIVLTYRSAPDSQLGRVHAYVTGHLWVDGHEASMGEGYGQHYDDGMPNWPAWLTEEARLHDPDAATAPASAPTDWIDGHPQLEAIAAAVWEKCGRHGGGGSGLTVDDPRNIAVAALAAVSPITVDTSEDRCAECGHFRGAHEVAEEPVSVGRCTVCADDDEWHDFEPTEATRRLADAPPLDTDRAAILRSTADAYDAIIDKAIDKEADPRYWQGVHDVAAGLRAMADAASGPGRADGKTQQTEAGPRHTCLDQTTAPGRDWECQYCSTLPESINVTPAAVSQPDGEA